MVARAPGEGGRIVSGGSAPDLPGSFYLPTLIADVDERLRALPRRDLRPGADRAHIHRRRRRATAGQRHRLRAGGVGLDTRRVLRAQRASREMKAGCVWINDRIPIISEMPHGGLWAPPVSARTWRLLAPSATARSSV